MKVEPPVYRELGEIIAYRKGKPPAQQPYSGPGAETYLTPEYLRSGVASEPIRASKHAVRVVSGETIVLWDGSNAGEILKAREGVLSSTMTKLHHSDTFEHSYFYYALKAWEPFLKGQTSGSGIPHVDKEVLERLEIIEFPKPEQTKIAEILSTVDRAIEQTEALIAKQQRLKTGLMQDLLTRGIDEHGRIRSEETHEFKDSPLGRIPVEWEVMTLNQVVDELITYGIVQAGPHIEDGVPYIRTGDMSGDAIQIDCLLRTSHRIAKAYRRSEVCEGDIVFALRATVGKVLPVDLSLHGANLTQGTAKISPRKGIVSAFLIQALRTTKVQDQIRLCEKGTTFMEITLTDLRQILVAMPKEESEQTAIAEALDANDRTTSQYSQSLGKLRTLKTALMQDLLNGHRRVTHLLVGKEETQ
jgi:type I restriction enzyme S subunit